jgi:hypothetical protein
MGWIVPTSLLAAMMLTSVVRSVSAAATSTGSTRPYRSTGSTVTVKLARSRMATELRTALCSTALVTR